MMVRIRKLHDGRWDHAQKCTSARAGSLRVSGLGGDLITLGACTYTYLNTALGSDGQGRQGFSFVFLDLFDLFDLFADLARASLGFLERPSRSCEVVRVRMDCTIGQLPH